MKRNFLVGIMLALVLSLSACGGNEGTGSDNNENVSQWENSTGGEGNIPDKDADFEVKKKFEKKEVTLENLASMEVSPIEDFEFGPDKKVLGALEVRGYNGKDEMVAIPDEVDGKKVVNICMVFDDDSSVKAVRIPDSVERISGSFSQNEKLQYVIFGSGLKEIGDASFVGCHSLKEVILNEGVEKIGNAAFADMENLTYMYIPSTVVEIGEAAIMVQNFEDFVIAGKAGSKAEEYAKENGFTFEVVE